MRIGTLIVGAVAALLPLTSLAAVVTPNDIIPRPAEVSVVKGVFRLPSQATYFIKGDGSTLANYLSDEKEKFTPALKASKADLLFEITGGKGENYTLEITPKQVKIKAPTAPGAFYGLQTLLQMAELPGSDGIACGKVSDAPRFPYRGMMVDVSRHFRSPEFLKKQIDAMAKMKLNRMHLHLTDAAGWRMEIDKYPRLTEFAAWRPEAKWQDWADNGAKYCESTRPGAYGGFYTKQQMRDLVKYAADRNITIIPEIEVPGHSKEVTSAYPELSCSGKPYVDEDLCIGKEKTFEFLEDVLTEVMDVFPSAHIHIGGDEASKRGWRDCPDCKARMEKEGLKNVDELQSYAIHRVEEFVNSKGRDIIGWDEILEGGLAPNATVMSWRGTEGGLKSIAAGHDVIMTPGEFCYIDYCQDAPFKEPISIGGYTPLKKVYSYEPLDSSISADKAHHLLGVQANLWAEYIPTDEHAEYMYYPRTMAIAEIGWSTPEKNYDDFLRRALSLTERLDSLGYNAFDLKNEFGERKESLAPVRHKAIGKKVTYNKKWADPYPGTKEATLVDGVRGGWTYGGNKRWQGFFSDFDVVLDMGEVTPLNSIAIDFMQAPGAWVHLPEKVEFELSDNGVDFTPLETVWSEVDPYYPKIMMKDYVVTPAPDTKARYIRIKANRIKRPDGSACLFTDEIIVN